MRHDQSDLVLQPEGVKNLPDILRQVKGIGAIWAGPGDMSITMGLRGNTAHPEVQANLLRILETCQEYGMPCATGANTPEQVAMRPGAGLSHYHYRPGTDYFWCGGASASGEPVAAGRPAAWSVGRATGITSGWASPGLARYRNRGASAERMIVSCWLKNFW
jgi:hypothetical protein